MKTKLITLFTGLALALPIIASEQKNKVPADKGSPQSINPGISVQAQTAKKNTPLKTTAPIPNRLIDYKGFLEDATEVGKLRKERRVTEEDFIHMSEDASTVIFDARSDEKYKLLHIKNAKHLSLPDVTESELAKIIPDKTTRILIYCNNNFENEPRAFPGKGITASLNIYTFNTLFSYGYKNVYELGPLIDINHSKLSFEGTNK